jgi:hypothetical protein
MGIFEDIFEGIGAGLSEIIPGVKTANLGVDLLSAAEKVSGDCLTGSGDSGRCPKQLKAFKLPPKPKKQGLNTKINLKNKREKAAIVYMVGGNFTRGQTSLDRAMQRIQQSFMGRKQAATSEGREKYIELYQKISGNDRNWFRKFDFTSINQVVSLASQIANNQITTNMNRDNEIRYDVMLKIREKVNIMLREMESRTNEYRQKGYVVDEEDGAGDRFLQAFGGRFSRATIPIKELYAFARNEIPGFAEQMDALENGFELAKIGLDEIQRWIDENDIPILDDIRDWYAGLLDFYKSAFSQLPGADDISKALTGKTVDDLDWIDIADSVGQIVNPVYGAARSAMELNKALRESLERKNELTEAEFIQLFSHYLNQFLVDMPDSQLNLSELDVTGLEKYMQQPQVPMSMINPGFQGTKPVEKVELIPNSARPDVNVEPTRVVVREEKCETKPTKPLRFCDQMGF